MFIFYVYYEDKHYFSSKSFDFYFKLFDFQFAFH